MPANPRTPTGSGWRSCACRSTSAGTGCCYGAPAATAAEADFVVAEQTIRHDAEHPSYITLPVIPRSGPGLAEEAR